MYTYTERDLVRIAKRENNKKRNYLVVNPLQGKHIPVSPSKALHVFSALAELLEVYRDERILVVGFAETATAIGAQVAIKLGACYIQTTRENVDGVEYLYFSEEHSHATEQKLVKDDIDKIIGKVDRVIFVEDEITTGKTILNIISVMEQCYDRKIRFSMASLLNGMSKESMNEYIAREIGIHYLVKINNSLYPQTADMAVNDGIYHDKSWFKTDYTAQVTTGGWIDSRRLTDSEQYKAACQRLYNEIYKRIPLARYQKILVLGTEEFMFPGMYVGKCLEEEGHIVRFHATTRSPITVSRDGGYPLHERYELDSFYEEGRKIYVYDIGTYDAVIVITDAWREQGLGEASLLHALREKNKMVYLVRWCNVSAGRQNNSLLQNNRGI